MDSKGNKYAREWADDKINGKGRLFSINGDFYEGYFNDGVIEGHEMYYSKIKGYKYLGEFKNFKFHGKGKLVYDNKINYEGEFVNGYKKGKGKLIFDDDAYYEGDFEKNIFNGKGKFVFKDRRNYNGDWRNNIMDRKGVFNLENGCKYIEDYKNNKRQGKGVYSYGDNLYDENWLNNMPHGEGTLLHDSIKIVGHFRYGKLLEIIEGKGTNKEMTQRFTIDSRVNGKSLEDTNKGLERSDDDIKNKKTEKYISENNGSSKLEKRIKNEIKKNTNSSTKNNKKHKSKEKDKDKEKKSKSKSKDKEINLCFKIIPSK